MVKEKHELLKDQKTERELKARVDYEKQLLGEDNVKKHQKQLKIKQEEYSKEIQKNRRELDSKTKSLEKVRKNLNALTRKIDSDRAQKDKLGVQLEKQVKPTLGKDEKIVGHLKKKEAAIQHQIQILTRKRDSLKNNLPQSLKAISEEKVIPSPFRYLLASGKEKLVGCENNLKSLDQKEAEESSRLNEVIQNIHKRINSLNLKKESLKSKIENQNKAVSDYRQLVKKRDHQKKLLQEQHQKIDSLRRSLVKDKHQQVQLEQKLKDDLGSISHLKELEQSKSNKIRKELDSLKKDYHQKLQVVIKKRSALEQNIHHLEDKKSGLWKSLESDRHNLSALKTESQILEKKLKKRELDANKEKSLLSEIKALRIEKNMEADKLSQVNKLIQNVKNITLTDPQILHHMEHERTHLNSEIQIQNKEISYREKLVDKLHQSVANLRKEFDSRKNGIALLQQRWLARRNQHQKMLEEANRSLSDLQIQLVNQANSADYIAPELRAKTLEKKSELSGQIKSLNDLISNKQKEHQKHLSHLKEIDSQLKDWTEQKDRLVKNLGCNKEILSSYDEAIGMEKDKISTIEEEEKLLRQIIAKIHQKEKLSELKQKQSGQIKQSFELQKSKIKEELSHDIARLHQEIQSKGNRKLNEMESLIEHKKKDFGKISEELQQEKNTLRHELGLEKHDLKEKVQLSQELDLLTHQKEEASQKISPLKNRIQKIVHLLPGLSQRLDSVHDEEKRIDEKISKYQDHLDLLKNVSQEKHERLKEKEMLHLELKQLQAVVNQKIKDLGKTRKASMNKKEVKELKLLLKKIDHLLGKLPKKEINKFSQSKDFDLYKKIMVQYGVK